MDVSVKGKGVASYADMLRSSPKKTEKDDVKKDLDLDLDYAVPFFWDFENTQVTPDQVCDLEANLNSSLQTVDPRYHLAEEKYGAGNTNLKFVSKNEKLLKRKGFVMEDSVKEGRGCCVCGDGYSRHEKVPYERVKEVADRMIVQRLQRHVLQRPRSKNIFLASGDGDFGVTLDILKKKGYTIFLALLDNAKPAFKHNANHVWTWEEMPLGGASTIWPPKK